MGSILFSELERLKSEVTDLGMMVEQSITDSIEILQGRKIEEAHQLILHDVEINRRRYGIESDALILIARQQPVAQNLRTLAAILEISSELERIGDYSKGIAKISVQLGPKPLLKPLLDIPKMGNLASDMVHRALVAFIESDAQSARSIPEEDSKVDDLYDRIYRELIACVLADSGKIDDANHLLWVAHNLERAADRAVNICERVIFTVTGELIEFEDFKENFDQGRTSVA